jgi:cellulose synthase/poly-beta-1,6-N-acetylglucosamine synthase-like glycosyltransferase
MQTLVYITLLFSVTVIMALGLYPVVAWLRSVLSGKAPDKSDLFVQPVSIIIAAHNEEKYIRQKIDSFLDPGEWIEGSELIVISNASTDSTNDILASYASDQRVKIIIEPENASKIKAVNRGVKAARHDLLVFSDCRQSMKKGSVLNLIRNFNDPEVGTVNSTLTDANPGKGFSFRSLLNSIARWESLSGSSLNVYGALYAQRKEVFREFPEDILFDDLYVVVSTILQKKRLVAEEKAVIYDVPFSDYYVQDRINRLARGLLLFLFRHFNMIRRMPLQYFMRFITYKYLKLILPTVLLILGLDLLYIFLYLLPLGYLLIPSLIIAVILVIKPARKFIIHFVIINHYFLIATLQFLFLKKRSNKWGKLGA